MYYPNFYFHCVLLSIGACLATRPELEIGHSQMQNMLIMLYNTVETVYSGHLRFLEIVFTTAKYPQCRGFDLFQRKGIINENLGFFACTLYDFISGRSHEY